MGQTLLNKSFSVCHVSGVNLFVMFLTRFQIFGTFVSLVFLGQAFTIMLVYVWSRRNPNVRMNFFGLLNFQAPFLPWVLMGFSLLLGNSIIVDLLGTQFFAVVFCHFCGILVMCLKLKESWVVNVAQCEYGLGGCVIKKLFVCFSTFLKVLLLAMCISFWRMFFPTSQVVEGG